VECRHVSLHGIGIGLQLVGVEVELGAGRVVGTWEGESAEHVGVDVLCARPVLHLEVVLLDQQHPTGGLALEVGSGEEPL
jgi:hypothetical protein